MKFCKNVMLLLACGFIILPATDFLVLAETSSCHIFFSPDTFRLTEKSHESSCFWKISSKIFWPDMLDKWTSDQYLKWTSSILSFIQGSAINGNWHSEARALVRCLLRKYLWYLWFRELRWTFFLKLPYFHTVTTVLKSFSSMLCLRVLFSSLYGKEKKLKKTKDLYCFSEVLIREVNIMPLYSHNTVSDKTS